MEGLWRLNPFWWSRRALRVFIVGFFTILLPVYLYIGFQPWQSTVALDYPALDITSIGLSSPVAPLELTNHQLIAPDTIAGAYSQNYNKTLIIGHSSTVFKNLHHLGANAEINYNGEAYTVQDITTYLKSDIEMSEILAASDQPTLIIMTCAGEPLPGQDATHRLVVTATLSD